MCHVSLLIHNFKLGLVLLFIQHLLLAVPFPSTHGSVVHPIGKVRNMDAAPADVQLGPGAHPAVGSSPCTGLQSIWTFTEGVTSLVSRPVLGRKVNRRSAYKTRQCKQTASCCTGLTGSSQTSPLDQTQDLLDAFPSRTTESDDHAGHAANRVRSSYLCTSGTQGF